MNEKKYLICVFAHPSSSMISLQLYSTGKALFTVRKKGKYFINLSCVATQEVIDEVEKKCAWSSLRGRVLETVLVSNATKKFIEDCWQELKKLKPELCIK